MEVFLKLYVLLYADDTILLSENRLDMQDAIDATVEYCSKNELRINIEKTKCIIFSKGKVRKTNTFYINGQVIERVDQFCYLGIVFKYNNTFQESIKLNVDKARKALFKLKSFATKVNLSTQVMLHLFDHAILPILLYGCEIWGYENIEQIEVFHRNFLRQLLMVDRSTPIPMVYGELGRFEIKFIIWRRMILQFKKLSLTKNKYSNILYKYLMYSGSSCKWLDYIRKILIECGIPFAFDHIDAIKKQEIKNFMKNNTTDLAHQHWYTNATQNSLCTNYVRYKSQLKIENYVSTLQRKKRIIFSKFRCAPSILPTVTARRNNTTCTQCPLCNVMCIPDEYHFLLVCCELQDARERFLTRYFWLKPTLGKFDQLMSQTAKSKLNNIADLCDVIFVKLKSLNFVM